MTGGAPMLGQEQRSLTLAYSVGAACLLTVFRTLYFGLPDYAVSYLAVPIATEAASPGTYPASDVLVQSGMHSGFHLYVALGRLAAIGIAPTASWVVGMLLTLAVLAWLVMSIAQFLTASRQLAVLSAAVVMAMASFRGTLAFSPVPSSEFMTASVGVDVVLLVLLWSWQRRWAMAGLAAGALCNIHPSFGSIALLLLMASSALYWSEDRPQIVRAWGLGLLTAAPNAIAMSRHLFAGPRPELTDASLFALFAPFQPQYSLFSFPADEFGFYTGMLVLALAGTKTIPQPLRRLPLGAIAAIHGMMLAYVVGVDMFHSAFVGIFLSLRATAIIKLLAVPLCCRFAWHVWLSPRPRVQRVSIVLALVGAAFIQNPAIAESLLLLVIAAVLWRGTRVWANQTATALGVLALASVVAVGWRHLGIPSAEPEVRLWLGWLRGGLPILAIPLMWRREDVASADDLAHVARDRSARPAPSWTRWRWHAATAALLFGAVVLRHPYDLSVRTLTPFSPSEMRHRIAINEPAGTMTGLEQWARRETPRSALFVLPPELRESVEFRTRAERGVFVTIADLAQLTYAPMVFLDAHRRAEAVGVRVIDGRPVVVDFDRLTADALETLRREGATHLVSRRSAPALDLPVVYADAHWVVRTL